MAVGGQHSASGDLVPRNRLGVYCIGGRVGPMTGLDGCGKSRPYRDSNPGTSSP
jgi:hypothetical protein